MSSAIEQPAGVCELLDQLAEFSSHVKAEDLAGLVGMHEACESLGISWSNSENEFSVLSPKAKALSELFQSIVLREFAEPQEELTAGLSDVTSLVAMARGEVPISVATVELGESDEDISAKLDQVFAEDSEPTAMAEEIAPPVEPEIPGYIQEPLTIADSELEFVNIFVEEASEHIEAIEGALLEVESSPDETAKIDDLFRPFHTIKGGAGFLNLRDISSLTHEVETLLDQGRKGERAMTPGVIDLVFSVIDILKAQFDGVSEYAANPTGEVIPQPPVSEKIAFLRDVVAGRRDPGEGDATAAPPAQRVGEKLVEQGAVSKEAVDYALAAQQTTHPHKKTGQILCDAKLATPKQVSQAVRAQNQEGPTKTPGSHRGEQSVRIDTRKLDAMVEMVGELVIAQTQVFSHPHIVGDSGLTKPVGQAQKIVREVQELAMGMRLIPVGPTFQKMARLVRDVSRKANKRVELHISGEDTELDKNVIELIGDPLVHMIRNACDHGVEPPDERIVAGKDEVGHVQLSASHNGGNILIEIKDDGRGLDSQKLIAKAVEKGIIEPDAQLSEQEALQLIFAPGFSTAATVTDISGRGVGMDVVKRNLEQLRGRVDIASDLGKGSTFSIRLPLTLAIIDGMIIRVGDERMIIQTIAVEQALRPRPEQIITVQHKGDVLKLRERMIPLVQLNALLGLGEPIDPCEAMVVVTQSDDGPLGLVVAELLGQQQVVIKPLGDRFKSLQGVAGGAVLGDGRIGLILDPGGLELLHASSDSIAFHRAERAAAASSAFSNSDDLPARELASTA